MEKYAIPHFKSFFSFLISYLASNKNRESHLNNTTILVRNISVALLLFFGAVNSVKAQCTNLGISQSWYEADSFSGDTSKISFCGITDGTRIGKGTSDGAVTFNAPAGGANYVEFDFNAISKTLGTSEYLQVFINGQVVDLNNGIVTFTNGFSGCASSSVASVTTPANLGYAGVSGVIVTDSDNGAGTVKIE
ncbi:hypothetical protein, partial [Winogradskyella sp.]|uniref:hypothetical protein n=1 Tax=Winogradskyella sp. TaxID=1883156 RepID=UPI0025F0CBF0